MQVWPISFRLAQFDEEGGYGTRATFTADRDGIIRHIEHGQSAIEPDGRLPVVRGAGLGR